MNENFTSLVFFTVLSQTATGALIFRELILLSGRDESITFRLRIRSLLIISAILLLSLLIAFLHLGKPLLAMNAINNLGKSWLSREIFSLSILLAFLLPYLFFTLKDKYGKTEKTFSIIGIALSVSFVYCMTMLYMIPAVVSWYNPYTPISYAITTLLCGIVLLGVIIPDTKDWFYSLAPVLIIVLVILSLFNTIIFHGTYLRENIYLFIFRIAFTISALLITAFRIFRAGSNKISTWWVILFVIVISSEIINRFMFFLSFEKSGL